MAANSDLPTVAWKSCVSRDCPSFGNCLKAYHGGDTPAGAYGSPWPYLRHPRNNNACIAFDPVKVTSPEK